MRCAKARSLFSAAYDGEAGSEAMPFASHVELCPACGIAYAGYRADMDALSATLVRMAAPADTWPERSWPTRSEPAAGDGLWSPWWWGMSALGASAAAALLLVVGRPAGEPPPKAAVAEVASQPVQLSSFAFDDCLEPGYELDRARVAHTETCPDNVRLPYRGQDSSFVLEQRAEVGYAPCDGVPLALPSGVYGCLEIACDGSFNELRWNGADREFSLRGQLTPGQAVEVASTIDATYRH